MKMLSIAALSAILVVPCFANAKVSASPMLPPTRTMLASSPMLPPTRTMLANSPMLPPTRTMLQTS